MKKALMTCAATLLLLGVPEALADASEKCVSVAGYEPSGEKESMDPAIQSTSGDSMMLYAVYNRLVDLDENFQVVPELATSWEAVDEGRVWTFHLREGVKFHDGSDFDAEDVVYTFRRQLDPALGSAASAVLSGFKPEDIQAVDPLTVRFVSKDPVAELPLVLANKFNLIVPNGAKPEDLRLHGIGTGPFIQEQFVPGGSQRILRRNPNYWKAGAPAAECLRQVIITEPLSAVAAIGSGEVDLLLGVDFSAISVLQADPKISLLETSAGNLLTLAMKVDKPPFDDVRVRKALKLVVDRQAMVDTVLLGFGEPGNDNTVPPSWPTAYTSTPLPRNIDAAKQLLTEAGHPNGIDIDLYTSNTVPWMPKLAEAYKEMASAAGIRVNIILSPPDSYWDNIWLEKSFVTSTWAIRPPSEFLPLAFSSAASWNDTNWRRADFDELLSRASRETDAGKREAIYRQAQQILSEESGVIVPVFIHHVSALRQNCEGYKPHPQNTNIDFESLRCGN